MATSQLKFVFFHPLYSPAMLFILISPSKIPIPVPRWEIVRPSEDWILAMFNDEEPFGSLVLVVVHIR